MPLKSRIDTGTERDRDRERERGRAREADVTLCPCVDADYGGAVGGGGEAGDGSGGTSRRDGGRPPFRRTAGPGTARTHARAFVCTPAVCERARMYPAKAPSRA